MYPKSDSEIIENKLRNKESDKKNDINASLDQWKKKKEKNLNKHTWLGVIVPLKEFGFPQFVDGNDNPVGLFACYRKINDIGN